MTEDQKYQGALYKDNTNKNKKARFNPPNSTEEESNHLFHTPTPAVPSAPITSNSTNNYNKNKQQALSTPSAKKSNMAAVAQYQTNHHHMSHAAYVEDVPDELEAYLVADDDDNRSDDNAPPHAPTPPPVSEGEAGGVNVFDFLVAGATPNASSLGLPQATVKISDGHDVSRYEYEANAYLTATDDFSMAGHAKYQQHLNQFGTGPVPTSTSTALTPFKTPAPGDRAERRKKEKESSDKDKEAKKDKKRKRLTLDISDQIMTDAPPVLHSGLTGGLKNLTTKHTAFPPSPQSAETHASPLKKPKHPKHSKHRSAEPVSNSLFSRLTSKPKTKKRKHRSSSPDGKKHSSSSSRKHRHESKKSGKTAAGEPQKLLEYHPASAEKKDGDDVSAGQLVVYKPRADLFLSFVNKGPDSERGCSMNKALKRFHRERERASAGTALAKPLEEKELFRSLRLRKNDRGEIVLFCVDDDE
ncbi:hypothetical protein SCUCBS95973_005848 [Sporothrix curviconia]|uniref:Uncharacterized protein n=1 Tax=Sporothrix curviconia TaxID=1260050 RepID=A0ABP0C172_9PEZI